MKFLNLKQFYKGLAQSEFFKHALTLFSGTIVSSLIPLIFAPIIARLFTPEEFGVYAVVYSLIAIFQSVASLRYETAVLLPEKDEDSATLVSLSFVVSIFTSVVVLLLICISVFFLSDFYESNGILSLIFFVPFGAWIVSFHKPINYWLSRFKKYKIVAIGKTFQGFVIAIFSVFLGWLSVKDGLVYSYLIGWFLYVVLMITLSLKNTDLGKLLTFKAEKLKRVATDYKEFPKLNAFPTFLNDLASQLSVLLITYFYSMEQIGYFTFSRQYAFVPLSLISLSVGNVYFQRIVAKKNTSKSIKGEFKRLLIVLSSIGFVAISVILIAGPEIFEFIFGSRWKYSGELTQVLIFSFVVKFIVSALSSLLPALKELKLAVYFPIVYFGLMCSLFIFRDFSFDNFVLLLTLLEVVSYLFYFTVIWHAVNRYEKKISIN